MLAFDCNFMGQANYILAQLISFKSVNRNIVTQFRYDIQGGIRRLLSGNHYQPITNRVQEKQRANQQYRLLSSKLTFEDTKMARKNLSYKVICDDADRKHLLDSFDTFLFDCDGVLWELDQPIPGSIDAINFLLENKKQVLFITNNSSKSRTQYAEKFKRLGFTPVNPSNIVTSGSSAAYYAYKLMSQKSDQSKTTVFYIGMAALGEELTKIGLKSIGGSDIDLPSSIPDWQYFQKDPSVGCVIVGADWFFTYAKATAAVCYLVHNDVLFIGTNTDARIPSSNPEIVNCGTGSIIKMVETGSGRNATYVGKPEPYMWEHVEYEFRHTNIDLSRTLMVGDTLYTDILFANSAKPNPIASLLVQTGNHKLHHVEEVVSSGDSKSVPSFISKSLKDALIPERK